MTKNTCNKIKISTNYFSKKKMLFPFVLLLISVSFNLSGQRVHNLNDKKTEMQLNAMEEAPPQDFLEGSKNIRPFTVNPDLQNSVNVSIGDSIVLHLFENKSYKAVIQATYTEITGNFTIILKLSDYPLASGFITTNRKGKSLFSLSIPELHQEYVSKGNVFSPIDFLIEIEESGIDTNLKNDYIEIPDKIQGIELKDDEGFIIEKDAIPDTEAEEYPCSKDPNLKGSDPATIDLLIVYTPAAKAWADTNTNGIENAIAGAMAKTAEVVGNQKNGDTLRLVHTALVNYVEDGSDQMSTDLDRLRRTNDGYMDEVHQWRKEYQADIVILFEFYPPTVGGLGYVLSDADRGRYEYAFNVCRIQQAYNDFTSIHEMGHNLGMRHDRENNSGTPLYPYAFGWRWTGNSGTVWRSVMAYSPGQRTPCFSNPYLYHDGVPTRNDSSNNARVFRNTKHTVAFYSDIINNLPEKPKNVIVSNATANGATFSWDSNENAAGYRVYLPSGSGYTYWSTTKASYTVNYPARFSPCTMYQIWIGTVNNCGDATFGDTVTFWTKCNSDPSVTTLEATDISNHSATLHKTVSDNGDAILTEGFYYKDVHTETWLHSADSILSGLSPSSKYKFYAYATTAKGTYNGSVLTFITSTDEPCEAPIELEVPDEYITINSAFIIWNGDAGEYEVEYKKQSNEQWTKHTPNTTTNSVTLTSLSDSTEYNVRIKSICSTYNVSEHSDTISFITLKDSSPIYSSTQKNNLLQIYPNPFNNEIFIQSDLRIEKVELYDVFGSILFTENNFDTKIIVPTLSAGIYILKIHTENGVKFSKIVKE